MIGKLGNLGSIVNQINQINNVTMYEMLKKVANARQYYTLEGTIHQIELFIKDPLGPKGGYLRCSKLYDDNQVSILENHL